MFRSYEQFNEADRNTITKLQIRIIGSYVAAFAVVVALIVANHSLGNWAATATNAEFANSADGSASAPPTRRASR
jgi:hypothetical protein